MYTYDHMKFLYKKFGFLCESKNWIFVLNETLEKNEKTETEKKDYQKHNQIWNFIIQLDSLDEKYKNWAKEDSIKLLNEGESISELEKKYQFYNQMAKVRDQIINKVPNHKKLEILEFINDILDEKFQIIDRAQKSKFLHEIEDLVENFSETQNLSRFRTHTNLNVGPVSQKIFDILDSENWEKFKELYENIFTKDFWNATMKMIPPDFPNFTAVFNFRTEEDFLKKMSFEDLKNFPKLLKKSALTDADEITSEFFSEKDKAAELREIKNTDMKDLSKILNTLSGIHKKREKKEFQAKADLAFTKKLFFKKRTKESFSEAENLKKNFGDKIFKDLGENNFWNRLKVDRSEVKRLEKEIKTTKNKETKEKLTKQLHKFIGGEISAADQNKSDNKNFKQKKSEILSEINFYRRHGQLQQAKSAAERLKMYDKMQANREIKRINEEMKKKADSDEDKDAENKKNQSPESADKTKKIEFFEKCIEHARKVMEACEQIGIPKDAHDFWKQEGIKNRVTWLKEKNLWEKYCKFNASDPNVPKQTQAGGFRFRWMDAKGSELTFGRAESGIKYMNRYKESGYPLAALAGAFSINWKSNSSPVYTPQEFISRVQVQLSVLRATGKCVTIT